MMYPTDPDQSQRLFVSSPVEGAGPDDATASVPTRSRRGLRVVIVFLSLALAVAAGGFAYSTHLAQSWRDTADRTTSVLNSTRQQRDDLSTQLAATQVQLATTRSQLAVSQRDLATTEKDLARAQKDLGDVTTGYNTATDRIRSLADEKAQIGDAAAFLAETVSLSDTVTQELDSCVSDLQKLQSYLIDFMSYDETQLMQFITDINDGCDKARSDNAVLADRLRAR